jgi:hypothetical protein
MSVKLAYNMLEGAKRASHINPPASPYAIMRRACPYRGENHGPGKDVRESLTTDPELENSQDLFGHEASRLAAPQNGR